MASLAYGVNVRPRRHRALFEKPNCTNPRKPETHLFLGTFEGRSERFFLSVVQNFSSLRVELTSLHFVSECTDMDRGSCPRVSS